MPAAALLILMVAQAVMPSMQEPPPPGAPHFGRPQTFIAPSGEVFRAPAGAPYPVSDWFAKADANRDGKLTESEFTADFLRFFASLDLDHDGAIDGGELDRYEVATPELHSGGYLGGGGGGSGEEGENGPPARKLGSYMSADDPQGAGRFDLLRIPEPVAAMDTDLKGRINRQKAQDAAEYRFSLLDINHHGYLLLAELPPTFAQQHHNAGGRHGHGHGGGVRRGGGGGMRGGRMGGSGDMGAPGLGE